MKEPKLPPPPADLPPFESVLTFTYKTPRCLEAHTQRPFKPRGLMLWDVGDAQLELITIGANHELVNSWGPIPARWFTTAQSFEQVAKAVAEGQEPPAWGSWSQVHVGQLVRLQFDREPVGFQALMWGEAIRW